MSVCYVFPHVPKCGGRSLLALLRQSSLRMLEDYDSFDGFDFSDLPAPKMALNIGRADLGPQCPDLIWGHFPIDRYQDPSLRYVTLLRDPLERLISNYHADHRLALTHKPGDDPLLQRRVQIGTEIAEGRLSIMGYLRQKPQMREIYKNFLCTWGAHHFALIGRTDRYEVFCEAFGRRLGVELPVESRMPTPYAASLSSQEQAEARRYLQEEYYWFDRIIETAV